MNLISTLTKFDIENCNLPINKLLNNSFYYPSCGFDGGIIKYFGRNIQSYIYCDYAIGENALLQQINSFRGYDILGHRKINKSELIPNGWVMKLPPQYDPYDYLKYKDEFERPFAHWVVYERKYNFDENHGPKRFSLIYIGGEGVATYQEIYWSNKLNPSALAIIQPGTGFGLNWTDFKDPNGPLAWVVHNNPFGKPKYIFFGGYLTGIYNNLGWKGYSLEKTIKPYYSGRINSDSEVTIWTSLK